MELELAGKTRKVTVTTKRIRNIYLRVEKDGSLAVSAPRYVGLKEIERFLKEKEHWISKTESNQQKNERINQCGVTGPILYWMGEPKYCVYEPAKRNSLVIEGDVAHFKVKDAQDPKNLEQAFEKLAKKELEKWIYEERGDWDKIFCTEKGHPTPVMKTRRMVSRWGVCAMEKNCITMSTRLLHYPRVCFSYVLLHEYAHLWVPNHSKKFYNVVAMYMPTYRQAEALLK